MDFFINSIFFPGLIGFLIGQVFHLRKQVKNITSEIEDMQYFIEIMRIKYRKENKQSRKHFRLKKHLDERQN